MLRQHLTPLLFCLIAFVIARQADCQLTGSEGSQELRLAPTGDRTSSPVVTAIALHPSGSYLAAAGDDHVIRIVSQDDFEEVVALDRHQDWVRTLDFSPQGDLMVSAGNDGKVVFWNTSPEWKIKQALTGAPALACARFSPVGNLVAAVGFDPQLFLIQPGGNLRPPMKCGCNDMRAVAFSDDMRLLVSAGRSGRVHLFDPGSGESAGEFELHSARIHDLAFLPGSDTLVSVGEDRRVVVFDTLNGEVLHTIPIPGCKLFTVAALDSSRIAVGGASNQIRVIDTSRGRIEKTLSGHSGSIAVLKANSRYLFSGSYDATIRRWSIADVLEQPRTVQRTDDPAPVR